MRQITSQRREAAARRLIDAAEAPALRSSPRVAAQAAGAAHHAACWAELMATRVVLAFESGRQTAPSAPRAGPPLRASSDFTSQVMARLAAPTPEPDPREVRAAQARLHMRRVARVYMALVLTGGVVMTAIAIGAPWLLLGVVAAGTSVALIALTLTSNISRMTGGFISGFGVAYLAMLAALAPPLLLMARRSGRGRPPSSRRS